MRAGSGSRGGTNLTVPSFRRCNEPFFQWLPEARETCAPTWDQTGNSRATGSPMPTAWSSGRVSALAKGQTHEGRRRR